MHSLRRAGGVHSATEACSRPVNEAYVANGDVARASSTTGGEDARTTTNTNATASKPTPINVPVSAWVPRSWTVTDATPALRALLLLPLRVAEPDHAEQSTFAPITTPAAVHADVEARRAATSTSARDRSTHEPIHEKIHRRD